LNLSAHLPLKQSLQKLIAAPNIPEDLKIRLVSLYALRYEKSGSNQINALLDQLKKLGISDKKVARVEAVLMYAGADARMTDLFANQDILARTKNVFKGLKV
jgi:hypothetical protein